MFLAVSRKGMKTTVKERQKELQNRSAHKSLVRPTKNSPVKAHSKSKDPPKKWYFFLVVHHYTLVYLRLKEFGRCT